MSAPTTASVRTQGAVLILGAVLAILDTTIVAVGLDAVARDLHAPLATTAWVATGYLLALAAVIPLSGWASERFGGRTTWMASVALFTAGSALCGLAWSAPALIAFRVLQGLGGGLVQPAAQAMFAQAAGPRLARLVGVVTLPATFAPVLGPVLGGVIVKQAGWRWMFLINVPLGVAALAAAARVLPRDEHRDRTARADLRGLALLSPGLAAFVYGLGSGVPVSTGLGALLLAAYGVHATTRDNPIVDLRLFRSRGFAVATGSTFALGATLYSSMILLPLFAQQNGHRTAAEAGVLLVPQALGTAAAALLAGRVAERIGPRAVMLSGIALALAGSAAFVRLDDGVPAWLIATSLLVRGLGLGATTAPGMALVYASVERGQAHRAAAVVNVANRTGGSLGAALLVTVVQHHGFGAAFGWALALTTLTAVPATLFPRRFRCA